MMSIVKSIIVKTVNAVSVKNPICSKMQNSYISSKKLLAIFNISGLVGSTDS